MDQPAARQFRIAHSQRHFGMDWLRIAAFALLILYHVAMVFAPWSWVVKAPVTYAWLIPPMALLTPWRLALLFAVSGYASRKLLDRGGDIGDFLMSRHLRLLVPLAFGMAVLVPVEMWVRVRETGYVGGYLHFWAVDYWRWGDFHGRSFPSWEHLWFVAYLWAYTVVLSGIVALAGTGWSERALAWLAHGRRLLWVPIAVLVIAKLALMFVVPERQGLFTDWAGHAEYGAMFGFGFAAAGTVAPWPMMLRIARPAVIVATLAGAVVVGIELAFPADTVPPHLWAAIDRAARMAMAWSVVLLCFHAAERWLNRDHRWRRPLAEAVFPAYIFHHPALVIAAWTTVGLGLPPLAEFALLLAVTAGASAAACRVGRRIAWLRPLVGLSRQPVAPAPAELRAALQCNLEIPALVVLDPADRVAANQASAMDADESRP